MDTTAIKDVSDTAFMVAVYRAMESERPDALFHDPLATHLAGEHGKAIVAGLPRRARLGRWIVAIRTCIIDDFITVAVAEGTDTVLNLGAGLDTRPYRMDLPASLNWIEVDYPRIIARKDAVLSKQEPRCRLTRIALDLADDAARQRLFSEVAGNSRKTLVLTEGVVPYLATQEAAALAQEMRAQAAFQYWIVDYLSPQARRWRQRAEQKMGMANAPFRFEPQDYFAFFATHGWQARETRYIADMARRLGRPAPLPFLLRLGFALKSLATKGGPHAMRKSAAYVLLMPADHAAETRASPQVSA